MKTPATPPVVVGVNGTTAALAAVRLGAREAVARKRKLRVVHAFTWPDQSHGSEIGYAEARHAASVLVDRAVAAASRATPGVRVSGHVVDGPAIRVLRQLSRTADLMVLGDDLTGNDQSQADSLLMETVARAFCPIVVVRGLRPPSGPLIAAVDGSATALEAVRHAAAEAEFREFPMELVHVVDRSGAAAQDEGRRVLAATIRAVPGLKARTRLLTGDPGRALVRASRQARMMAIGPRGRDGTGLLGPVAAELLHHSACPTIFVHGITAGRHRGTGTVRSSGSPAA